MPGIPQRIHIPVADDINCTKLLPFCALEMGFRKTRNHERDDVKKCIISVATLLLAAGSTAAPGQGGGSKQCESDGCYTRTVDGQQYSSQIDTWIWCQNQEMKDAQDHWSIENANPLLVEPLTTVWKKHATMPPQDGNWPTPSYFMSEESQQVIDSWEHQIVDQDAKRPDLAARLMGDWVEYMQGRLATDFDRNNFKYALALRALENINESDPTQDLHNIHTLAANWADRDDPTAPPSGVPSTDFKSACNWFADNGQSDANSWGIEFVDHLKRELQGDPNGNDPEIDRENARPLPTPSAFFLDWEGTTGPHVFETLPDVSDVGGSNPDPTNRAATLQIDGLRTLDELLELAPAGDYSVAQHNQSFRYNAWLNAVNKRVIEELAFEAYLDPLLAEWSVPTSNWRHIASTWRWPYPFKKPYQLWGFYIPSQFSHAAPVLYPPGIDRPGQFHDLEYQLDFYGVTPTGNPNEDLNAVWVASAKRKIDACQAHALKITPWIAPYDFRDGLEYHGTYNGQSNIQVDWTTDSWNEIMRYALDHGVTDFILWEGMSQNGEYDWTDEIAFLNHENIDRQVAGDPIDSADTTALEAMRQRAEDTSNSSGDNWTLVGDMDDDGDVDSDDYGMYYKPYVDFFDDDDPMVDLVAPFGKINCSDASEFIRLLKAESGNVACPIPAAVRERSCCPADITGGPNGEPDGQVTAADFTHYVSIYSAGDSCADLTGGPNGEPDGQVTSADYNKYLDLYNMGCQ